MNKRDQRRRRMLRQLVAQGGRAIGRQLGNKLLGQRRKPVRVLGAVVLLLRFHLGLRLVLGTDIAALDAHRTVTGKGQESSGKCQILRLVFLFAEGCDRRLDAFELGRQGFVVRDRVGDSLQIGEIDGLVEFAFGGRRLRPQAETQRARAVIRRVQKVIEFAESCLSNMAVDNAPPP